MTSKTYKNFEAGMLDDPTREDLGGFEFASGMDIFSEKGVIKACQAMTAMTFGAGASLTGLPYFMVDTVVSGAQEGYTITGAKVLKTTDGSQWTLFLTNGQGANLGLEVWNGYVAYASASKFGRAVVSTAASQNDSLQTLETDEEYHPMMKQGGTLKVGAGRYVSSFAEDFTFTSQALKLEVGRRVKCLAEYLTNLYVGTLMGGSAGAILVSDASVFQWRGTVLSSGSALPDIPFPIKLRGMNSLGFDGENLFAFPDRKGNIYLHNGAKFVEFRKLARFASGGLTVSPGGTTQHTDGSLLFAGEYDTNHPGVYQMKGGALCQAFVPTQTTPGSTDNVSIGFVKSSFNGKVFVGYQKSSTNYIDVTDNSNKQNNAIVRTVWHRHGTDKLKRHVGVKLNLKPMAASTSVAVAYRTARDASFTDSGVTISSSNQDKPVIFTAQPRSREIQFRFTFTTNSNNTPELLSYDPIYEVLNTVR